MRPEYDVNARFPARPPACLQHSVSGKRGSRFSIVLIIMKQSGSLQRRAADHPLLVFERGESETLYVTLEISKNCDLGRRGKKEDLREQQSA